MFKDYLLLKIIIIVVVFILIVGGFYLLLSFYRKHLKEPSINSEDFTEFYVQRNKGIIEKESQLTKQLEETLQLKAKIQREAEKGLLLTKYREIFIITRALYEDLDRWQKEAKNNPKKYDIDKYVNAFMGDINDMFEKLEISVINPPLNSPYNPKTMKVISTAPTTNPALNNHIKEVKSVGFKNNQNNIVTDVAQVVIYNYNGGKL